MSDSCFLWPVYSALIKALCRMRGGLVGCRRRRKLAPRMCDFRRLGLFIWPGSNNTGTGSQLALITCNQFTLDKPRNNRVPRALWPLESGLEPPRQASRTLIRLPNYCNSALTGVICSGIHTGANDRGCCDIQRQPIILCRQSPK